MPYPHRTPRTVWNLVLATTATLAVFALLVTGVPGQASAADSPRGGTLPVDENGKPLNLDFERGNLDDWTPDDEAFNGQPIRGDTVSTRRDDMRSQHVGEYWIGTYEQGGDQLWGTLTSRPFKVAQPYASFLVAGGAHPSTRVEIYREDTGAPIYQVSGDNTENLQPIILDLKEHVGKPIYIRLVDNATGGWGHINFDDFRFHEERPTFAARPNPPPLDQFANAGISGTEAAAAMKLPEGFAATLCAEEPEVTQPIAQAIDDRGRLWVAEAYSYPVRVPDDQARDRILIFEDTDGDGRFDKRKVFTDKLNLVSGLEIGFGGVWVGAAPEFLFIPDADGDDQPDGPPQVLLDGWGYHDTHETLNSFIWGPDGWLYGCHGVFTHSRVGKPGTPDDQRERINAGIWRYHPQRHEFEVFAHGTSNPWGVDFNDVGQSVLTCCVIPHLFHVAQHGRFFRQAGQHFNPYTYDDIRTIALHRHWVGETPHGGNERSGEAGGGHAHCGAMIYLGGSWPDEYRNQILMNNIHGARLNMDRLAPQGSGLVGDRAPDFLLTNDRWSQIINMQYGPDGQMYMIDWYDRNQCHHGSVDGHDRSNGRIYRVAYKGAKPVRVDLKKKSNAELVELQLDKNDWYVRHARRLLQERGADEATRAALAKIAFENSDETRRLRGMWALHVTGGLSDEQLQRALGDKSEHVRGWAVQLACERGKPSAALLERFAELAAKDPSSVVRLYLSSALARLPNEARWDIVERLTQHAEDAGDHNLPLMYWYAAEPLAEVDASRALRLALASKVPPLPQFMVRRIGAIGTPEAIVLLVGAIEPSDDPAVQTALVAGIRDALKGRRQVEMPAGWKEAYAKLRKSDDAELRSQAQALAITFGDAVAMDDMRTLLADKKSEDRERTRALEALVSVRDAKLPAVLHDLLADTAMRPAAVRALAAFDDEKTPDVLLAIYGDLTPAERRDALMTLASRAASARKLLAAVGAERVQAKELSADIIRQLGTLKDKDIDAQVAKVWGTVRESKAERQLAIAAYKKLLTARPNQQPRLELGRAVFAKTCQQCHTLFGTGAKIGPELTGSNRADLDYVLSNVLDSSALVGKDYQATVIVTADGRNLTGIVREETADAVTIVTQNETVVVPKSEIDERELSANSMMPDDLWKQLSEHEIRSLVAYLASPQQVSMLATADNVAALFNGRDLTGWQGNMDVWSVEDGEVVGKSAGLARNEFLYSDLTFDNFRLKVEVKLVNDAGNSGIQFRSQPIEHGEMRGYQADMGVGWWGKLYEEQGRALLWDKSGEQYVKKGEWNTYEIIAVGERIRTYLNGHLCVDLDDAGGAKRGVLGLQVHSGDATEVRFRNFEIELSPKLEVAEATEGAGQ